jgi:hypothetical protein
LIILTVSALAVAVLVHPAPENGNYSRALAELTSVEERFDRPRVEQMLLTHAHAQAKQPLQPVVDQVAALRPVALKLSDPALSLDPIVHVQLASLTDIDRLTQADAAVPASIAGLSGLGRALAWRLAHTKAGQSVTLRSAELQPAAVSDADVSREDEIFAFQSAKMEASAAVEKASAHAEQLDHLYEARVKWHVSRKLRVETYQARQEAHKALRDAQRALRDADKRYTSAATATLDAKPEQAGAMTERGVVRLSLELPEGIIVYVIPVLVTQRTVAIPPLQGASFRATREAGLWNAVKDLNVADARRLVQERFTWHNRHIEIGGMKLGGMTVLQLLPCVLPLLLQLLLTRMRAVTRTYNPFRTRVRSALPRIGFRTRLLDAVAVVILPLTAAAFAVTSLILVGQLPALPLLAAVACLLLGGYAFIKLGELQRLAEDVVRSHSVPPAEQE